MRLALLLGAALALGGCSLTLDPEGVKAPAPTACVPTGCAGKACGYDDCGNICTAGSGCLNVHSVARARVGAAGASYAAAGHGAEGGLDAGGAAMISAPTGHAVDAGTIQQ
jgi:hypothetical protein